MDSVTSLLSYLACLSRAAEELNRPPMTRLFSGSTLKPSRGMSVFPPDIFERMQRLGVLMNSAAPRRLGLKFRRWCSPLPAR